MKNETKVYIISPGHWANGEWGIIKGFDGEYYHVALYNGREQLIFTPKELKKA